MFKYFDILYLYYPDILYSVILNINYENYSVFYEPQFNMKIFTVFTKFGLSL